MARYCGYLSQCVPLPSSARRQEVGRRWVCGVAGGARFAPQGRVLEHLRGWGTAYTPVFGRRRPGSFSSTVHEATDAGRIHPLARLLPLLDGDGGFHCASISDVTDRRDAEASGSLRPASSARSPTPILSIYLASTSSACSLEEFASAPSCSIDIQPRVRIGCGDWSRPVCSPGWKRGTDFQISDRAGPAASRAAQGLRPGTGSLAGSGGSTST